MTDTANSAFGQDVEAGLSASPKYLSSKYFYDAAGDELFQQIMALPEYYLTVAEENIFRTQSASILRAAHLQPGVQLIELGAGDGMKTTVLLQELQTLGTAFSYHPIDISAHVLGELEQAMKARLGADFPVAPVAGEYFEALESGHFSDERQRFLLFLGSTIGNFDDDDGTRFLSRLAAAMRPGDCLLVGFDLQKDAAIIKAAYDDAAGVTRAFNFNLLTRINRELDADFNLAQFRHAPVYDARLGAMKSFLESTADQKVHIGAIDRTFTFTAGERIYTEISRKYTLSMIETMAESAGLEVEQVFYDERGYFADVLMGKRGNR